MADQKLKLTKRNVDGLTVTGTRYRVWDSDLAGFGLRVTPAGAKSYFVVYRPHGGGRAVASKEYTIGKHGAVTPDQARKEAERLIGGVRLGKDPQEAKIQRRNDMTVDQLCDLYIAEGMVTKKPSTRQADTHRINGHIRPLLGGKKAFELDTGDIERWLADVASGRHSKRLPSKVEAKAKGYKGPTRKRTDNNVRGGKGTATRTFIVLRAMMSWAIRRKIIQGNPCEGVKAFPTGQSQRYLSAAELMKLGQAMEQLDLNQKALDMVRLLLLTGCRKTEIQALRWDEVDFNLSFLRLVDSKTSHKVVQLGVPALGVLAGIRDRRDRRETSAGVKGSPFVFPGDRDATKHFVGLPKIWNRLREAAGIADVRMHDLRHTFASVAIADRESLHIIGKVLGHKDPKTTARYAHLADDPMKAAAHNTAEHVAAAMAGQVIPLRALKS